ncbi:hypothetical protein C8R47DRAFT_1228418 [Mycena vitilis]|nr:hypothetical protein C8R47DRAFT_1228418 [Mycena vitilis]
MSILVLSTHPEAGPSPNGPAQDAPFGPDNSTTSALFCEDFAPFKVSNPTAGPDDAFFISSPYIESYRSALRRLTLFQTYCFSPFAPPGIAPAAAGMTRQTRTGTRFSAYELEGIFAPDGRPFEIIRLDISLDTLLQRGLTEADRRAARGDDGPAADVDDGWEDEEEDRVFSRPPSPTPSSGPSPLSVSTELGCRITAT